MYEFYVLVSFFESEYIAVMYTHPTVLDETLSVGK